MASSIVGNLIVRLAADTATYESGIRKSQRETDRRMKKMRKSIENFRKHARRDFNRVAQRAGLMAAAFTAATVTIATKTLNAQDKVGKLSQQLGISTEALSELQFAAEQTGSSSDQLSAGLAVMSKRLGEVAYKGSGAAAAALDKLGLSAKDLIQLNPEQQFNKIADAMSGLSSQAERNAVAANIFSRANQKLVNTLALGSGGMAEMRAEARKLGRSISEEQAAGAAQAMDAINRLSSSMTGARNIMASSLSPAITAIANGFASQLTDSLNDNRNAVVNWGDVFGRVLAFSADAANGALAGLKYGFASFGSALGATAAEIGAALKGNFSEVAAIQKAYVADQKALDKALLETNLTRYRDELEKTRQQNDKLNASSPSATYLLLKKLFDELGDSAAKAGRNIRSVDVPQRIGISSEGDRDRDALTRIREDLKSQEQVIEESYRRRVAIVERSVADQADAGQLLGQLDAQRLDKLAALGEDTTRQMSEFARQAQRNIQDTLGDTLGQTLRGDFDGIGDAWKTMVLDMVAQAQAASLANALFGKPGGEGGGGGLFGKLAGFAGSALGAYFGGGAGAASAGIGGSIGGDAPLSLGALSGIAGARASGGPVSGGKSYLVGERGPELFNPASSGHITPNHAIAQPAANATNLNVQIVNAGQPMKETRRERSKGANGEETIKIHVRNALTDMVGNGEFDEVMSPYDLGRQQTVT